MSTQVLDKHETLEEIKLPKKWKVIMHNDDITPMDFVVEILKEIFEKTQSEAVNIMLNVHNNGKELVGVYPKNLAQTKIGLSDSASRANGFNFKLTMEEE